MRWTLIGRAAPAAKNATRRARPCVCAICRADFWSLPRKADLSTRIGPGLSNAFDRLSILKLREPVERRVEDEFPPLLRPSSDLPYRRPAPPGTKECPFLAGGRDGAGRACRNRGSGRRRSQAARNFDRESDRFPAYRSQGLGASRTSSAKSLAISRCVRRTDFVQKQWPVKSGQ